MSQSANRRPAGQFGDSFPAPVIFTVCTSEALAAQGRFADNQAALPGVIGDAMQFTPSRADIVHAINQRWLLKFWQRHLGDDRAPKWQAIEAENLSNISNQLSFLDITRGDGKMRFMIRFHGAMIGEVYGSADCRGKYLDEIIPHPAQAQAPYLRAAESGCPVYTIHDVIDRNQRTVHYERLLLPFARDGRTVDRILASFEFVCPDGAFETHGLMTSQTVPPALRLSAMIEPRALA